MPITFPITLPPTPVSSRLTFRPRSAVSTSVSPFTYQPQSYKWAGQLWMVDVDIPPMKRAYAEPWASALTSLSGLEGSFLLSDYANKLPRGDAVAAGFSTSGQARVRGASQTGSDLNTQGWYTGGGLPVFKAGDWIQLGGRNLLTKSAEFDHANWVKVAITPTAGTANGPDGSASTADTLTSTGADGYIYQDFTPAGLWGHMASIYIRSPAISGTLNLNVTVRNSAGVDVYVGTINVSSGWNRRSFGFTPIDLTTHRIFFGGLNTFPSSAATLRVWGAMVDPVPYLREYQPATTTAYDVKQRLHKVLNDVWPDASGYATLNLWPSIISSPADNAPITFSYPHGKFMLSAPFEYSIDAMKTYGSQFSAVEDLRP